MCVMGRRQRGTRGKSRKRKRERFFRDHSLTDYAPTCRLRLAAGMWRNACGHGVTGVVLEASCGLFYVEKFRVLLDMKCANN